MRKPFRRILEVPLYNSWFTLSVSDCIAKARKREDKHLGEWTGDAAFFADCGGMTCSAGGRFGVFLLYNNLLHEAIAHELLHATFRILDGTGTKYNPDNSEPFTYLNGYLHKWTYHQLAKAKIKVSH